jgi:hypothetical protein
MSRRVTLFCVLSLVALVAAAVGAALERAVWIDLDRVETEAAPPCPWPETAPTAIEERLSAKCLSFNFNATPLEDAVQMLTDLTKVTFVLDPSIDGAGERVSVRVLDVTGRRAVDLVLQATRTRIEAVFESSRVRLVPVRGPLTDGLGSVSVRALSELAEIDDRLRRQLAGERIAFAGATVQEALDGIGVGCDVAAPLVGERPVTARGTFTQAALLDAVTAEVGLHWHVRGGVVVIESGPAPLESRVSCELIGATVPDLVAALAKNKVVAVATDSAWRSRGTFSISLHGVPLSEAIAAIASESHLEIRRLERRDGEVVVLDGAVPCVQDVARARDFGLRGVAAQLRARRRELARLVAERARRRAAADDDFARLLASERAVHDAILSMTTFLREVEFVGGSRASVPAVVLLRTRLDAARAAEKAARDALDGTAAARIARVKAARNLDTVASRLAQLERGRRIEDAVALLGRLEAGEPFPERW